MSNSMTNKAGVCVIELTQGRVALVSRKDHAPLSAFAWFAMESEGRWYAARNRTVGEGGKRGVILMHRHLLGCPPGMEVHHRNEEGLDNRRRNIVALSRVAHQATKHPNPVGVTGYRGVTRHRNGKYLARVNILQRCVWSGYFITAEEAAHAYDAAAKRLHGASARLNFPGELSHV